MVWKLRSHIKPLHDAPKKKEKRKKKKKEKKPTQRTETGTKIALWWVIRITEKSHGITARALR